MGKLSIRKFLAALGLGGMIATALPGCAPKENEDKWITTETKDIDSFTNALEDKDDKKMSKLIKEAEKQLKKERKNLKKAQKKGKMEEATTYERNVSILKNEIKAMKAAQTVTEEKDTMSQAGLWGNLTGAVSTVVDNGSQAYSQGVLDEVVREAQKYAEKHPDDTEYATMAAAFSNLKIKSGDTQENVVQHIGKWAGETYGKAREKFKEGLQNYEQEVSTDSEGNYVRDDGPTNETVKVNGVEYKYATGTQAQIQKGLDNGEFIIVPDPKEPGQVFIVENPNYIPEQPDYISEQDNAR